jgi:hypothetical protein
MASAGAGAGIYNTTRQVGAVLGSAGIAVLMQARLSANLPGMPGADGAPVAGMRLPAAALDGFASAMAQSVLLPAGILLVGLVAVLTFAKPDHVTARGTAKSATSA